ncbi:MAG: hypothetical protein Q8O57_02945, partial [Kiritimatiellota bacterium]|nr:hypothetical protein [Kiritimatiellota bacterium]
MAVTQGQGLGGLHGFLHLLRGLIQVHNNSFYSSPLTPTDLCGPVEHDPVEFIAGRREQAVVGRIGFA